MFFLPWFPWRGEHFHSTPPGLHSSSAVTFVLSAGDVPNKGIEGATLRVHMMANTMLLWADVCDVCSVICCGIVHYVCIYICMNICLYIYIYI